MDKPSRQQRRAHERKLDKAGASAPVRKLNPFAIGDEVLLDLGAGVGAVEAPAMMGAIVESVVVGADDRPAIALGFRNQSSELGPFVYVSAESVAENQEAELMAFANLVKLKCEEAITEASERRRSRPTPPPDVPLVSATCSGCGTTIFGDRANVGTCATCDDS